MSDLSRPFSPTALDSPLLARLGRMVRYEAEDGTFASGVLANVTEDRMATISDARTLIVVAVVPVEAIEERTTPQRQAIADAILAEVMAQLDSLSDDTGTLLADLTENDDDEHRADLDCWADSLRSSLAAAVQQRCADFLADNG